MSYIKVNDVWHKSAEERNLNGMDVSLLDCTYQPVRGPRTNKRDDNGSYCPLCSQGKKASEELKAFREKSF